MLNNKDFTNYNNIDNSKKETDNILAFREAYNEILYHYDSSKEKEEIRALIVRKENLFYRLANKVKMWFYML